MYLGACIVRDPEVLIDLAARLTKSSPEEAVQRLLRTVGGDPHTYRVAARLTVERFGYDARSWWCAGVLHRASQQLLVGAGAVTASSS
jgi:hypothetical protein